MSGLSSFLGSRLGLATCLGVAGLGAYLLWTHTGHVLSAAPYLFLLACPLLHFFGHGHHHHDGNNAGQPPAEAPNRPNTLRS